MSEAVLKRCSKCGEYKALDDFYHKSAARDGLTAQCKGCISAHQKQYREANAELLRDKSRSQYLVHRDARRASMRAYYLQNKERWYEYVRRRRSTKEGRLAKNQESAKWREANPEKYTAQYQLNNAIKLGKVERPGVCSLCGKASDRIHGHHPDYSKPLEVIWLCESCHKVVHAKHTDVQAQETEGEVEG